MNKPVKSKLKGNIQDLIYHLMIKAPNTKNVGLLNGKMGVTVAFYELSRKQNNEVYGLYADELLDEIFESINVKTPIDFESGLTGIGWGLEYLIQNRYVDGDSLDICEVIDSQLMHIDIRRLQDFSLETGLYGFLSYILAHISNCLTQSSKLPFDTMYLDDLYRKLNQLKENNKIDSKYLDLVEVYLSFYHTRTLKYQLSLSDIIESIQDFDYKKLQTYSIGMRKGLVSHLLNQYYEKNIHCR